MNVYDFDDTIFVPDSSFCFVRFCLRHYPRAVFKVLPLDNVDRIVQEFWEENFARIEPWYLEQRRSDDLIISASPEFLLRPAAERLGVSLLATPMNPYTGKIMGKNCHDREKVRRFLEHFERDSVENFYSDSLSDTPMAELARRAFLIKDHQCLPWPGGND